MKFKPQSVPPKSVGIVEVTYDPRRIRMLGYRYDIIQFKTNEWFNSEKRMMVLANVGQ